ncbi:twin-arginine translocation signal domain-containing protein [Zobellia nedashkovskayae]
MNRRKFIKNTTASTALVGLGGTFFKLLPG